MKAHLHRSALLACLVFAVTGCGGSGNNASQASPTSAADESSAPQSAPTMSAADKAVEISFDQVQVATSAGTLRTDVQIKNISKDPVQCDPSEFSVQLGSATPIDADTSAAVDCEPDSIDPGTTGKATMYFDIPGDYTGPATVILTVDDTIVGEGTTQLH